MRIAKCELQNARFELRCKSELFRKGLLKEDNRWQQKTNLVELVQTTDLGRMVVDACRLYPQEAQQWYKVYTVQ